MELDVEVLLGFQIVTEYLVLRRQLLNLILQYQNAPSLVPVLTVQIIDLFLECLDCFLIVLVSLLGAHALQLNIIDFLLTII